MLSWFPRFKRSSQASPQIPLRWSLLIISCSVLFVSGGALLTFMLWPEAPTSPIRVLFHASFSQDKLPGAYFVALLELQKSPKDFARYDTKAAEKLLRANPTFEEVSVRKVRPDALCVNYSLRHPVATLGNRTNTGLDEEGVLIPLNPYFAYAPKSVIYVQEEVLEGEWGKVLPPKSMEAIALVLRAWKLQGTAGVLLKCIDISRIEHPSAGRREIILTVQEIGSEAEVSLRLSQENLCEQLAAYRVMRAQLDKPQVIDLRNPSLALVK